MSFTRCYSCMHKLESPNDRCPNCGLDNEASAKSQAAHALPCGYLLHGKYVVGSLLGQGGFGVTYIGWDLALETRVCIKEYFPSGAAMRNTAQSTTVTWSGGGSAEELKRGRDSFIKEARKAVKLRTLNAVVQVWDVFYENETAYLVMDFVDGVTLKSYLMEKRKPLGEEECVRLLLPVMKDLEEVHARGIIHRDISPDNLMLQPDGTLVLLDIGAAKDLSTGSGQSSMLVAKKGFSPMEQYASGGSIGPWTDVYAMCATIVYCVTGKIIPTPMDRLSGAELDLCGFSPAFSTLLKNGLAIRSKERIQSMTELAANIERALKPTTKPEQNQRDKLSSDAIPASALKSGQKLMPKSKPKNRLFVGILAAVAAFGAIAVIMLKQLSLDQAYKNAERLMETEQYTQAYDAFSKLGKYKDSLDRAQNALKAMEEKNAAMYSYAERLLEEKQYAESAELFYSLGDYRDAAARAQSVQSLYKDLQLKYDQAAELMEKGNYMQAFVIFRALESFKDAPAQTEKAASAMRNANSVPLTQGGRFTVGLHRDGTVVATKYLGPFYEYDGYEGQCEVSGWTDIVSAAAGSAHTVGLRKDGTVVAVGDNDNGECDLSGWSGIVAIAAGSGFTVGLHADGTVVATGHNNDRNSVYEWTDIVAIATGVGHTVGLHADGTVVAAGNRDYGQCNVSNWTDIVAIAADSYHTVGLRADGTVVVAGEKNYGQQDVSEWKGIVSISAGDTHVTGLLSDGTVIAAGSNYDGQCNVSNWKDIVSISSGGYVWVKGRGHTLGLRKDGTVIAVGDNQYGQCNVADWTDIGVPNL